MTALDILRRRPVRLTISEMDREDVEAILWLLADIRDDTGAIRKILENEAEEEDGEDG